MCSRADSDQNASGQVWYGPTEAVDFIGEISGGGVKKILLLLLLL